LNREELRIDPVKRAFYHQARAAYEDKVKSREESTPLSADEVAELMCDFAQSFLDSREMASNFDPFYEQFANPSLREAIEARTRPFPKGEIVQVSTPQSRSEFRSTFEKFYQSEKKAEGLPPLPLAPTGNPGDGSALIKGLDATDSVEAIKAFVKHSKKHLRKEHLSVFGRDTEIVKGPLFPGQKEEGGS
jgi:hypothetical protein